MPRASERVVTPTSSSTTRPEEGHRSIQAGLWSLPEDVRSAVAADLEKTFAFLFEQLNVNGTEDQVNRFIHAPVQHHAALKPVLVAAADDPDAGE